MRLNRFCGVVRRATGNGARRKWVLKGQAGQARRGIEGRARTFPSTARSRPGAPTNRKAVAEFSTPPTDHGSNSHKQVHRSFFMLGMCHSHKYDVGAYGLDFKTTTSCSQPGYIISIFNLFLSSTSLENSFGRGLSNPRWPRKPQTTAHTKRSEGHCLSSRAR